MEGDKVHDQHATSHAAGADPESAASSHSQLNQVTREPSPFLYHKAMIRLEQSEQTEPDFSYEGRTLRLHTCRMMMQEGVNG